MAKTISIDLETPENRIHSIHLKIPTQKVKFTAIIPPLFELFDKIIDLELSGKTITCSKGCGTCCNQLIPLSIPEAFYIFDLINSFPPKRQKVVKKRFHSTLNTIMNAGLYDGLYNPRENVNIDKDYFKLGLACPFLEMNQCTIYEYRPFVCRDFHVVSPKNLCKDPYENQIEKIKIKWNIGALTAAYSYRLYGLPSNPIPLSMALNWRKKNKPLIKKKWPGVQIFQTILDCLPKIDNKIKIAKIYDGAECSNKRKDAENAKIRRGGKEFNNA